MTKREKIRNSFLLLSYTLLDQTFTRLQINPLKADLSKYDYEMQTTIRVFRWMYRVFKTFAKKEIQDFANKRLAKVFDDDKEKKADVWVVGLFVFYLYLDFKRFDRSDWIVPPFKLEDIQKALETFDVKPETVKLSYEFALALDPNKTAIFEFKKLTNRLLLQEKLGE